MLVWKMTWKSTPLGSAPTVIVIPSKAPAVAAAVTRLPTAVAVQVAVDQDRDSGSSALTLLVPEEKEEEEETLAPLALLPLPQQIELLKQRNAAPELLVDAYRNFGNLYRDRVEQGDASPETITTAIQAYEKVLPLLPENFCPLGRYSQRLRQSLLDAVPHSL